MDNERNTHFATQSDVSSKIVNKNKKIRCGILLNDFCIEAWNYNILKSIADSEYASIDLIIVHADRGKKDSYFERLLANRKKILFLLYNNLENRIIQPQPDAFTLMDAQKLIEKVPVIEIQPKMDTYSDWINEKDVENIKKFNLDVILWCGIRTLKGDILNAAKLGVWSYHHNDTTTLRGGPPGFWETFERKGERGTILYMVTDDQDEEVVLYRSSFPCHSLFVKRNNNECYLRSSSFVLRTLKKLYNKGEDTFFITVEKAKKRLNFYDNVVYETPNNFKFFMMLTKHAYRIGTLYLKSNFFPTQWFLMYDLRDTISTSFWHFKKIIPPRDRFWADPHIFFRDNRYYIFIEEYIYKKKKGHISLIEMNQSGKYTDPVTVLDEPFHLSYPHVFEYNGTLFMIPETQQAKSINLYQCTDFPYNWKHRATLIDSIDAVDSTMLFHKNKWWLFTNIADSDGTPIDNELYLFYSDTLWGQNWKSHPLNPVISDIRRARPAGKILIRNGQLYRPSQCGSPSYGYGIKLNEIVVLTENDYKEREITFIEPKWDKNLNGIHTFCHENRLTMIDGNYNKFVH